MMSNWESARATSAKWSFAPGALVVLLGGTLATGGLIGGVLASEMTEPLAGVGAAAVGVQDTFDTVRFRAEEREATVKPSAAFDAIQFRAEERERLGP